MVHVMQDFSTLSCGNADFHVLFDLWALSSSFQLFSFCIFLLHPQQFLLTHAEINAQPNTQEVPSLGHFCSLWNSLLSYLFLKILVSLTCLNFDLCLLHVMRRSGLCGLRPPCTVAWKLPLAVSWAVTELTLSLSLLSGMFHPTLWILPGFWVVEGKRVALTFVTPSWLDIETLICKTFDKNLVVRNSEPVHKLAKLLFLRIAAELDLHQ